MIRVPPPDGKGILLSWVSVGAKTAPLLSALEEPSPLFGKIERLYLFWRDAPDSPDRPVLSKTRTDINQALDRFAPEIVDRRWETDAAPTDHTAIRKFVEGELRRIRADHPGAHLYLHLSPGTPAMHAVWLVLGATGFVTGPLTMIQSIPIEKRDARDPPIHAVPVEVDTWLRRHRSFRPKATAGQDDGQLWDPDAFAPRGAMRRTVDRLHSWASMRAPVLLLGERGTGKSTLANVLRAAGPFQKHETRKPGRTWPSAVCGQFRGDPKMARSELFGHERGAFTGADKPHDGLLTQADGDCLFLDEIADLDRDTQRQLMHAVEGRGFRRLGGTEVLHSHFRLICATNRAPEELAQGILDADFYDRIAVFTLTVPPLRACPEDLGVFWAAILARVMPAADVDPSRWEPFAEDEEVLERLRAHALPGNLRDLERVAWHLAVALGRDASASIAVEEALRALPDATPGGAMALPPVDEIRALLPLQVPLPVHLDAYRQRWMEAALAETDDNKSAAAELLGVPRETLNSWVRASGGEAPPASGERKPSSAKRTRENKGNKHRLPET
jgi:DNA-binding NtrC family response regulator